MLPKVAAKAMQDHGQQEWSGFDVGKCMIREVQWGNGASWFMLKDFLPQKTLEMVVGDDVWLHRALSCSGREKCIRAAALAQGFVDY